MTLGFGIAQMNINVTDLTRAKAFYADTLGFKARERFGPDAPFELVFASGPVVMVYRVERVVPFDYPKQTGTVLVFSTDDIQRTVRDWKAKGVSFIRIAWSKDESGIAETPLGPFIAFRDPFGNVHELLQPRG